MTDRAITLDSVKYELDPTAENPYIERVQPQFIGEDQDKFWQTWAIRSWHGGERLSHILSQDDLNSFAYHDGEGIDVAEWGQLKLQPALERSLAIQSVTMPMVVTADGQAVVVGVSVDDAVAGNQFIRRYASATWSSITTPNTGAVTDLIAGTGATLYGIQGTHIIVSADSGATWTNDASTGVPTDMVGLAYCAGQLFALGATYLKYWDGAAWQSAAAWGGTCCCTYAEDVWFANGARLYRYNGTASFETDCLPGGFVINALIPMRNVLLITGYFNVQGGKRGAVYYILDGHEAHLHSIGSYDGSSNYTVSAACVSDDELYIANQKRGGTDRYDLSYGGLSSGPAWGSAGVIPFKSMAYANGYLFVGRYDNTVGTDGIYIANVARPSKYAASGWVTSPTFDFFFSEDQKLVSEAYVRHSALAAGEAVQLLYSLDEGTTWVSIGTNDVDTTTSASWTLSAVKGQTLKLKCIITAGTSQGTTPTVKEIRLKAAPVTALKWMWNIQLAAFSMRGGRSRLASLKASIDKQSTLTFVDLSGTSHTVAVKDSRASVQFGDKDTAKVVLELREV